VISGADAISTVKIEEQRPGKRSRNVILKLAPPKDQASAWELNYFLAVGKKQRRAECALCCCFFSKFSFCFQIKKKIIFKMYWVINFLHTLQKSSPASYMERRNCLAFVTF